MPASPTMDQLRQYGAQRIRARLSAGRMARRIDHKLRGARAPLSRKDCTIWKLCELYTWDAIYVAACEIANERNA